MNDVSEKLGLKGVYTITKAFLETPQQFALDAKIKQLKDSGKEFLHLVKQLNTLCRTEKFVIENIIPTVGRQLIANQLTDSTPDYVPYVNKVALGSGTNTPANGDTTLQTEVYRNDVASRTNASNIGYITGFFSATETTGTYREAGLFCAGTGSANTGVLLSRVAINITKSSSETLTIDWAITVS